MCMEGKELEQLISILLLSLTILQPHQQKVKTHFLFPFLWLECLLCDLKRSFTNVEDTRLKKEGTHVYNKQML